MLLTPLQGEEEPVPMPADVPAYHDMGCEGSVWERCFRRRPLFDFRFCCHPIHVKGPARLGMQLELSCGVLGAI